MLSTAYHQAGVSPAISGRFRTRLPGLVVLVIFPPPSLWLDLQTGYEPPGMSILYVHALPPLKLGIKHSRRHRCSHRFLPSEAVAGLHRYPGRGPGGSSGASRIALVPGGKAKRENHASHFATASLMRSAMPPRCRLLHIRHLRTRHYTPRTNGKAERFIQTLLREWAYALPY